VRAWIDAGPYLAAEAEAAGIVDGVAYGDELPAKLAALDSEPVAPDVNGEPREARPIPLQAYVRVARPRFVWEPLRTGRAEVAGVPVLGPIRTGAGEPTGIVGLLRLGERERARRGPASTVPERSGLGSAVARRACSRRKPVIASLGDTAASGGYYLAMARASRRRSCNLTGSIGVVMAELSSTACSTGSGSRSTACSAERARASTLGRARTAEARAPAARSNGSTRASSRRPLCRKPEAQIEAVAGGRVWTRRRAHELGLVDALGGLDDAVALARTRAGLGSGEAPRATTLASRPWERLLARRSAEARAERFHAAEPELSCPIRIALR
jgi:protease-4